MSPKFRQEDGYTFKIYSNEEERKHVHVVRAECEAKFWLEPQIELAANYGFGSKDLKKRTELVEKCEDDFKQQFAADIGSVLMIDAQGMMLSVLGQDSFVSYNRVPRLRDARVSSALNVLMVGPNAFERPELDVDLEIESLKHPERYPLVMKRSSLDVI